MNPVMNSTTHRSSVRKPETPHARTFSARTMAGVSLVEVMVTLAIGMVVTLGIVGIMGLNQQNLRITESLSESQENARMAFELIARDVRQARDTSCGPLAVTNTSFDDSDQWWGEWWPIRGFAGDEETDAVAIGDGEDERVDGTQALQIQGSGETRIIKAITGSKLELQTAADTLNNGPIIVCNLQTASLHVADVSGSEENAITTDPLVTVSSSDDPQFHVSRLTAVTWYIGNNDRANEGGRSLYRIRLQADGSTVTEEILPGVVDMSLRYHARDAADFTNSVANQAAWNDINAIELTLTTESTQRNVTSDAAADSSYVGSDGRMRRQLTHVIALRNNAN